METPGLNPVKQFPMKKIQRYLLTIFSFCGLLDSAYGQLILTSGWDPNATPNASYASVQFWNFSNSGGIGEFAAGTGNNLHGTDYQTWSQQTIGIQFTYVPTKGNVYADVSGGVVGVVIPITSPPPSELQVLVANSGLGDLTLALTSINSVAYGGTIDGEGFSVYGGTPPTFTSGSTLSAANGSTLQAYLNNPTLFSAAFTLHGTITLDSPANSTYYGDGLNSLIEFNLTATPEPAAWALMVCGASILFFYQHRGKTSKNAAPRTL